jgi:hypothetical protein
MRLFHDDGDGEEGGRVWAYFHYPHDNIRGAAAAGRESGPRLCQAMTCHKGCGA